jgi:hypothetical protein
MCRTKGFRPIIAKHRAVMAAATEVTPNGMAPTSPLGGARAWSWKSRSPSLVTSAEISAHLEDKTRLMVETSAGVRAIVTAMEKRRAKAYVPRWVGDGGARSQVCAAEYRGQTYLKRISRSTKSRPAPPRRRPLRRLSHKPMVGRPLCARPRHRAEGTPRPCVPITGAISSAMHPPCCSHCVVRTLTLGPVHPVRPAITVRFRHRVSFTRGRSLVRSQPGPPNIAAAQHPRLAIRRARANCQ